MHDVRKPLFFAESFVFMLVERLTTFGYFIPTIAHLQHSQSPATEVRAKFSQWITLDYARVMLGLAAWLAAPKILAFTA